MPRQKSWGIYVYFAADVPEPQMQLGAWQNLQALASAGCSDTVGVTAMIDLPCRDTEYYLIPSKPANTTQWAVYPDRFLPNVNSASVSAVLDFFHWSHMNCPADNVALVFWGHGYALDDYDPLSLSPAAIAPQNDMGRTYSRVAQAFPGGRGQELKLLYDATHNSVLNNRDFAMVIDAYRTNFNNGKKVQVLGLDCCNMAMAEVLSELQDHAEFIVAAETGLPFQSWLSASTLETFMARPVASARDFAIGAVDDFISSFARSNDAYVGLSACNLGAFKKLETTMNRLSGLLFTAIEQPQYRVAILNAWLHDVSFLLDGMIDLSSFCELLSIYLPATDVADAAAAVADAVQQVVIHTRVAPDLPGRKISLSTGLSIWFPPWIQFSGVDYPQLQQSRDYLHTGYPQTRFAQATGWSAFLLRLLSFTQG